MTGSTSTLLWILLFVVMIVGMIIQRSLTSKFRKYSKIPLHDGLTGKEVLRRCSARAASPMWRCVRREGC